MSKKTKKKTSAPSAKSGGKKVDKKPIKKNFMEGWRSRSPLLKFLAFFVAFMLVFYAIYVSKWFQEGPLAAIMNFDASISSFLLNLLGMGTTAAGDTVGRGDFSVSIEGGCDGIEAIAIFAGAVLAYPKPFARKYKGIVIGVIFLLVMNIVRIMTLYITGVYAPMLFDIMHVDVWQVIFIALAIGCWLVWMQSVIKYERANEAS